MLHHTGVGVGGWGVRTNVTKGHSQKSVTYYLNGPLLFLPITVCEYLFSSLFGGLRYEKFYLTDTKIAILDFILFIFFLGWILQNDNQKQRYKKRFSAIKTTDYFIGNYQLY